ncbi:MAG: hypothetical protein QXF45_00075 [Candidatus Caldarchaeum sp.]
MQVDIVYWSKFIAGIGYGLLAAWIIATTQQPLFTYLVILMASAFYVLLAETFWRTIDKQKRRRQSYLNGLGGFIGVFLVSWILFFNLLTGM